MIRLPRAPAPIGAYVPGTLWRGLGLLSGQFPLLDGHLAVKGRLGDELSLGQGREAARLAALNVLAQISALLDGFDRLLRLLRVDGVIACDERFLAHAAVLDGASIAFDELLGAKGRHARSVLPVARLPMDAPLELVVSFAYVDMAPGDGQSPLAMDAGHPRVWHSLSACWPDATGFAAPASLPCGTPTPEDVPWARSPPSSSTVA